MILELLVAAAVEASKKQLEKGSRVRLDLHLSNNPIKTRVNITYSIISSEREGKSEAKSRPSQPQFDIHF